MKPAPMPENRNVVFRFHGGPYDGLIYQSDDEEPGSPTTSAHTFWVITNGAPVGVEFIGPSPVANSLSDEEFAVAQRYRYKISNKIDDGDNVTVDCDFVQFEK